MPKYRLLTPGPVAVPERVRLAMARSLLHHRAPEFVPLFREVRANLRRVFQTEQEVLVLASSGTGAPSASRSRRTDAASYTGRVTRNSAPAATLRSARAASRATSPPGETRAPISNAVRPASGRPLRSRPSLRWASSSTRPSESTSHTPSACG